MRVLYWTESFWPRVGGSEVAAAVLIRALRARGHRFEVVTRRWSEDQPTRDAWEGVPVHRIGFDDQTYLDLDLAEVLPLRRKVSAIKKAFGADLVHVGLTGPSLFLHNFTAGQFPAPTLITMHVAPVDTEYGRNKPVHEAMRAAAWVAPVSRALADEAVRRVPSLAGRCGVIHNALPDPGLGPTGASLTPPRLVCIGRLTEQKGFDTAVAAMPTVLETFSDATLTIVGDGEDAASLPALAERLGVTGAVRFTGEVPPEATAGLIRDASLVLMPSRWEPFGLVALQAAQLGRVCLASAVDGLPEVIADQQTGRLLPPDDPAAWAGAVVDTLRRPAWVKAAGDVARRRAAERFSVEAHADAYERLYHRLVGQGGQLPAPLPPGGVGGGSAAADVKPSSEAPSARPSQAEGGMTRCHKEHAA